MAVERKRITQLPVNSAPLLTDVAVTDRLGGTTQQIPLGSLMGLGSPGFIYGLTLANNVTDATNDIDFAAGVAASTATLPFMMSLDTAITKQLDAAWAVGTNAGGRMSAAAITDTTYHCYLIQRSDTGVVDAGFDVSATSPTLPANYDRYRRIGSVVRTAGALQAFLQNGNRFLLTSVARNITSTNPGTSAVLLTLASVPTGITVDVDIAIKLTLGAGGAASVLFTCPQQTDTAPGATIYTINSAASSADNTWLTLRTDTSARIRMRSSFSDANTAITGNLYGWTDTRGQG